VPANLRATAALADAGIIAQPAIDLFNSTNGSNIGNGSHPSKKVTVNDVATLWETAAPPFFEVVVDGATAENRLQNFVVQANLSQALLNSAKANSTTGTSSAGMGNKNTTATNVTFYALSLMADGSPVQVCNAACALNTDLTI
jgi:hypothetical protein